MSVKICVAQVNTAVGGIKGNTQKIISEIKNAEKQGADIIVFPELTITGYPPEDLLFKKSFVRENIQAVKKASRAAGGITAVIGFVNHEKGHIFNSAAIAQKGRIKGIYNKVILPNYGVFDEKRYFTSGGKIYIFKKGGLRFGVTICEDMWQESKLLKTMKKKTDAIINLSASPYHTAKWKQRKKLFSKRASQYASYFIYANLVGGQDEVVFDGYSMVMDKKGRMLAAGRQFAEDRVYTELLSGNSAAKKESAGGFARKTGSPGQPEEIYGALVLGTRDYIIKNGFKKAVVALSGGIDSALVSVIAADALGPENVDIIYMPSAYSAKVSLKNSKKLAKNLGIKLKIIDIRSLVDVYSKKLKPYFKGTKKGTAEENLQSRIRGNLIMAFSNKFGSMVLTTGNKSEMSVGYATLYGDMAGGFAVIKDVPKTMVYELARDKNRMAGFELIPESIINRVPTAELKPNQKDADTLPPYPVLDRIIGDYIENDKMFNDLKNKYDKALLKKVIKMIDKNEYKRRQAPPGVKITPKAFGRDRRMPVTNKYSI